MKYIDLKIKVNKDYLEQVEGALIAGGFTDMLVDDPDDARDILAHPDTYRYDYINEELAGDLGRQPSLTLYFTDDEDGRSSMAEAEAIVRALADAEGIGGMTVESALAGDDSEWLYKWQEYFKPTKVGDRIVVKPSWEDYDASEDELVIEMDPGMAFGSGLHETTSMCIKALEKIMPGAAGADGRIRVLDVGTGTGILAIAAALLGADDCLGIDIDTDAVRVACENIAHNGLDDRIRAQYGDLTAGVDYRADIIVANLMADLVIRLTPDAAAHLRKGGYYITSGILAEKEETVSEAIREAGFCIEEVLHDGEWCAIIAV